MERKKERMKERMNKRKTIQWLKDWWEAFNEGLIMVWPEILLSGILILVLLLMLQK